MEKQKIKIFIKIPEEEISSILMTEFGIINFKNKIFKYILIQ